MLLFLACAPAVDVASTPTVAAPKPAAPTTTAPPATAPNAAPAATPATPAGPPPLSDTEAKALSGQTLVILGSKRVAEPIPGADTIAAHPELGAKVQTLRSGDFKNLMPCYTVTIAGAFSDAKAAQGLSTKLRGLGVDHYLKNAGAWTGGSEAVDAWCTRAAPAPTGRSRVLSWTGERAFAMVSLPEETVTNLVSTAPAPRVVGKDSWEVWTQPLTLEKVDDVKVGDTWNAVAVETGEARSCTVRGFSLVTLGVPHFGVLQLDEKPKAPACGAPAPAAELDCGPAPKGPATWVAAPSSAPKPTGVPLKDGTSATIQAALDAALAARPDWTSPPADEDGEITTKTTSLRKGTLRGKPVWLGVGRVEVPGECGGGAYEIAGVWEEAGGKAQPLVAPMRQDDRRATGLVDLDGQGVWLTWEVFPASTELRAADGSVTAELPYAYCDCPC